MIFFKLLSPELNEFMALFEIESLVSFVCFNNNESLFKYDFKYLTFGFYAWIWQRWRFSKSPATQLEKKNALKGGRFLLFGMPTLLFKFLWWEGRRRRIFFHFSLVPNAFPLCSLQLLNEFSSGSQYVPQVPNMSSMAPHFYPICFGKCCPPFTYIMWAKGEKIYTSK